MDIRRICGVVLVVMAVVVAVHTIVEPLYYTSTEESPYSPVWAVLGWVMMLPLALGVWFGYLRKKSVESGGDGGAVTRELVAANVHFYGGACSSASCFSGTGSTRSPPRSPRSGTTPSPSCG